MGLLATRTTPRPPSFGKLRTGSTPFGRRSGSDDWVKIKRPTKSRSNQKNMRAGLHQLFPQPGNRDIHLLAVFRHGAAGDVEAFAVQEVDDLLVGERLAT